MATGAEILRLAYQHVGERYENVLVPKNNARWKGPWDCAEFATWCVFQWSGVLYGCIDNQADPAVADAYTGAWRNDARVKGRMISVDRAAVIVGAAILRFPPFPGKMGHIVFSDGAGGTVEAHSRARGVTTDRIGGRRWDTGVLVPWVTYDESQAPLIVKPPKKLVYRLLIPPMRGATVKEIQRALKSVGFHPGRIDGIYGPLTEAAVTAFQIAKGLVADGEVGAKTARRLGVKLPDA